MSDSTRVLSFYAWRGSVVPDSGETCVKVLLLGNKGDACPDLRPHPGCKQQGFMKGHLSWDLEDGKDLNRQKY